MTAYPYRPAPPTPTPTPSARAAIPRLLPAQVRRRRFRATRLGTRGLDADDVYPFLTAVAAELSAVRAEAAQLWEENARIKRALHDWQSAQAVRHRTGGPA